MKRTTGILTLTGLCVAATAFAGTAQQARMEDYKNTLEDRVNERLERFRLQELEAAREAEDSDRTSPQRDEQRDEKAATVEELSEPFKSTVNVYESNSGEGQDVEIRLTMPVEEFMEFAPIAALEAAAVNHKFPVVYIVLREETTDRVARVAFKDAEPIAGRYLADDENAVEEMKEALIWH